jgi:hypothetical protein
MPLKGTSKSKFQLESGSIFQSVIEPIALYGSEVWGPISNNELTKWDKDPIEILHAEFCETVLQVPRKLLITHVE